MRCPREKRQGGFHRLVFDNNNNRGAYLYDELVVDGRMVEQEEALGHLTVLTSERQRGTCVAVSSVGDHLNVDGEVGGGGWG